MSTWAIVPVKPLHRGKSRLATVLSVEERMALTLEMFNHVVSVLQKVEGIDEILVVTRDDEIVTAATARGTRVFSEEDPIQLNSALAASAEYAWQSGVETIIVIPSDLGLLESADVETMLAQDARIAICPDNKFDGTNALVLRKLPRFVFRYGEQSFMKHLEESSLNGQTAQVVYADSIEFDLDTPADLRQYKKRQAVASG